MLKHVSDEPVGTTPGRRKRFGIWLIVGKRSFFDRRIWREDERSHALQTPFQRRAGVRYVGRFAPRFADASTAFGTIVPHYRPRSMGQLFKNHFHTGPVVPNALSLRNGYRAVLARATGYAIIATPRLRPVSCSGAVFVGYMRVRDD